MLLHAIYLNYLGMWYYMQQGRQEPNSDVKLDYYKSITNTYGAQMKIDHKTTSSWVCMFFYNTHS